MSERAQRSRCLGLFQVCNILLGVIFQLYFPTHLRKGTFGGQGRRAHLLYLRSWNSALNSVADKTRTALIFAAIWCLENIENVLINHTSSLLAPIPSLYTSRMDSDPRFRISHFRFSGRGHEWLLMRCKVKLKITIIYFSATLDSNEINVGSIFTTIPSVPFFEIFACVRQPANQ